MAVREGVAIESLCSLAELVRPDVAELVIEAYWKADGPEPTVYTIDLGWKLLSIARSIGCLDDVAMERLDDMRASLETHRRGGLTEKNMILVRQVISGDVWRRVINLPEALMAQARLLSEQSPVKAAVTAQLAVAIAILTNAPVRLSNLVQIRLDKNLNKPGGPDAPYMLVFPNYDVKNRVDLEFPFDQELTGLIDEYVHHFRPSLLRGSNELFSALLHHRDPRIREKYYNRASCLSATQSYSALVRALRKGSANQGRAGTMVSTRLRIWGSGVRISSGAPIRSET
jgi:hypothetical protein